MPDIIRHKVIIKYYNDLLAGYFGSKKTRKLMAKKYFWPSLRKDVKEYIKSYDICLASKVVKYKFYENLQSLPVLIYP